jgi:hypothetical protein
MRKIASPMMVLLGLAACAPQAQPPASSAGGALQAAAASAPTAGGERWDVTRVRCMQLLGAADDDRAAATMFYYGYLAARAGLDSIDVGKIDSNIHRVMEQCGRTPDATIIQAFDIAFGRR